MEYLPTYTDDLYLAHHGIRGMKWGVRRYENYDGTLTPAGRKKYAKYSSKYERKAGKSYKKAAAKVAIGGAAALATRKNPYLYKATPYIVGATAASAGASVARGAYRKSKSKSYMKAVTQNKARKAGKFEKAAKIAAGAALAGGAAYALHKTGKDKELLDTLRGGSKNARGDISKKVSGIKERLTAQSKRAKANADADISTQKTKSNHSASDSIREANARASRERAASKSRRVSDDIREANANASRARAAAEKQQAQRDIFAQQMQNVREGLSNAKNRATTGVRDKFERARQEKIDARREKRQNRGRHADDTPSDIRRVKAKMNKAKRVYGAVKNAKNADIINGLRERDFSTIAATADILNQAGINPNTVGNAVSNVGSRAKTAVVNRVKRRR